LPYISLNDLDVQTTALSPEVLDGVHFAHAAVRFAALALMAEERRWALPQYHLQALAVELAFKSLALRSGASLDDCRKASHRPSSMIRLIERFGTAVPEWLKRRIGDDDWLKSFLLSSRYRAWSAMNKSLESTIWLHSDYPEMIAAILEVPCKCPLRFEHGSALAESHDPSPGPQSKLLEFTADNKGKLVEPGVPKNSDRAGRVDGSELTEGPPSAG
jgi:hypothetical protein